MNRTNQTILKRASQAFSYLGYKTEQEQATFLSESLNVSHRTALAWIRLERFPRNWVAFMEILMEKGINPDWLWKEKNQLMTMEAQDIAHTYQSLPDKDRETVRMIVDLMGSKKTEGATISLCEDFTHKRITKSRFASDVRKLWLTHQTH